MNRTPIRPGEPRRRRGITVAVTLALTAGGAAAIAQQDAAAAGSSLGYTLEACIQGYHNSAFFTFPDNGPFVCDNDDAYTTGNLGKNWNELDNVPHRLTLTSSAAGSVSINYGGDFRKTATSSAIAWDYLSPLVLNSSLSTAGLACDASPSVAGQVTITGATGGAADTIQRTATLTMPDTGNQGKCVYDYYQRLAVGAQLYPGSSAQSYVVSGNDGSGKKTLSIPVQEAEPQAISKSMSASRDATQMWSVTKSPTPANVNFTNTCPTATTAGTTSASADVTVTWTKVSVTPSGDTSVLVNISATNPAARSVTLSINDKTYAGPTADNGPSTLLDERNFGPFTIPANTTQQVVTNQLFTLPSSLNGSTISTYSDVATASYTDAATGVSIPQTTSAKASTGVDPGTTANSSVTVSDSSTISGSGFSYKVTSIDGPAVTFDSGALDTETTGEVAWHTTAAQSTNGSATVHQTVYAPIGTNGSGSLDDTATLSNGEDTVATSDAVSVGLSATTRGSLTISKTLSTAADRDLTFNFTVPAPSYPSGTPVSVTVPRANTPGTATIGDLLPGDYTIDEPGQYAFIPQSIPVTLAPTSVASCSVTASIENAFDPPTARVRKITDPAGDESGWTFTLTGPEGPNSTTVEATTTGTGYVDFDGALASGTYTVTETDQAGWDLTGVTGSVSDSDVGTGTAEGKTVSGVKVCVLTVDQVLDADRTFSCSFTNTHRGRIVVDKVTNPSGDTTSFGFTLKDGPSALDRSFDLSDGTDPYDSGLILPGSGYKVAEGTTAGWDLTSAVCDDGSAVTNVSVSPGETVTCTFTNTKQRDVKVIKTQNGGTPSLQYSFRLSGGPSPVTLTTNSGGNVGTLDFGLLKPGSYTLCELAVPAGTGSTLQTTYGGTLDAVTGDVCLTFNLTAGADRTFSVDNSFPGGSARTIGYWKNWATCSKASPAKAAKTGNHLLDEFLGPNLRLADVALPYTGYVVDTCAKGVAVLSGASGKYAENQLAAQLLAARLNVAAGAAHSATTDAKISAAIALLTQIKYSGPTSAVLGKDSTQRTTALTLATYLDNYNNSKLT